MPSGLPLKDRRILVLCPDWTYPSGGVRKIYRHVEVLNALGYRAFIRHGQPGFHCGWFQSDAPIVDVATSWPPDPGSDLIVCPEIFAWHLVDASGVPKIVFNQNAYLTFHGMRENFSAPPYLSEEFIGTIVVSDDTRACLNYVFPKHRVWRIHNAIDPSMFYPATRKSRRIAYMPRKLAADARQVIAILHQRGSLDGFEVVAIDKMSEVKTAQVLCDAMIFLSFSSQEGSPLPPLEAMACGCLTIGYDGQGGREYLNNELAIRVAEEDIIGFVKAVESAIAGFRTTPELLAEKMRRASAYVKTMHSPQRERDDIAVAWNDLTADAE